MPTYTLDLNSRCEAGLYTVLKDGEPTKARASDSVVFCDDCLIFGGEFRGGEFRGGEFRGGVFRGGVFWGGLFWDGVFWGGVFRGGKFRGGVFWGGVFRGGEFRGGVFWGGEFRGGVFRGGVFRGGEFRGGEFRGGEFRGGFLPLQIQGSKHFINIPAPGLVRIGCQEHPIDFWLKNFQSIGLENGYSKDEIAEYHEYILLCKAHIDRTARIQSLTSGDL